MNFEWQTIDLIWGLQAERGKMNKLYFRYLLEEFLKVFLFCLIACGALWLIADLLGSLDDFVQEKSPLGLVVEFYLVQFPKMLLLVIPVAFLFSTLFTLLTFTRHHELIALQASGVSWSEIYRPFIWVGIVLFGVTAFLSMGPANHAESRRKEILEQIRTKSEETKTFKKGVPYFDSLRRQVWYVQALDAQKGEAEGVEITILNELNQDDSKYVAESAKWNGNFWVLKNVKVMRFESKGSIQSETPAAIVQDGRFATPPVQLALLQATPDELSFLEILHFLKESSNRSESTLSPYRTELFQQVAQGFSPLVLLIFAFCFCGHETRRNPAAGVFNAIFILMAYYFVMNFFLAMGNSGRLPAFLSAMITPVVFAGVGMWILAQKTLAFAKVRPSS
jgi:lipopolysaccharide export system permease protein